MKVITITELDTESKSSRMWALPTFGWMAFIIGHILDLVAQVKTEDYGEEVKHG